MRGNSQAKDNLEITTQQQKETARNYNAMFLGILTSVGLLWNREGAAPLKNVNLGVIPEPKPSIRIRSMEENVQ